MEKGNCKNEIFIAVTLLLCLWFKLDAILEYGMQDTPPLMLASCGLLLSIILFRAVWLLLTNPQRLWTLIKGIFKSEMFDAISWIPFLMLYVCSEKYSPLFACIAWTMGDLMLIGSFIWHLSRDKSIYTITQKSS